MACRCGLQYQFRYMDGLVIPPGMAALKGRGLHGGAQVNMRQKLDTRKDLPAKDIVDAAVAAFETDLQGDVQLTDEEQSKGKEAVVGEAKDSVVKLAQCHAEEQAPEYQPVLVETKVTIELPNLSRDLLGIIDLADEQGRVVDFKTTKRKKPQSEADDSVQLTTYAAAYAAKFGKPPESVRLDVLVQTDKKTERQAPLDSARGPADFAALAHRINALDKMIEHGVFMPAPPGSWYCSVKWCGYWGKCPAVNSERRAAAEKSDQ